ncbi:hypothetical protein, partial [Acinetobacter guillouiae]|uniref:hypothetical protein n=1 Tax=Acinetobacter guillouiae TaxID=106649 RepID=UPI003009B163
SDKEPGELQARRILREIDTTIKSGVDLGIAWLCKGMYFSYMSKPEQMDSAFKNSITFGAIDAASYFNRSVCYQSYGYFDEAMYGYSLSGDKDAYVEMQRILRSTLDIEKYEKHFKSTEQVAEINKLLSNLKKCDLNLNDLKTSLDIFLDILRSKKLRFTLSRYSVYEDEYALFFALRSNIEGLTREVLSEYDKRTSTLELFEKSRKLNIIMFEHTPYFERISA